MLGRRSIRFIFRTVDGNGNGPDSEVFVKQLKYTTWEDQGGP